jgi:hypothetical protein
MHASPSSTSESVMVALQEHDSMILTPLHHQGFPQLHPGVGAFLNLCRFCDKACLQNCQSQEQSCQRNIHFRELWCQNKSAAVRKIGAAKEFGESILRTSVVHFFSVCCTPLPTFSMYIRGVQISEKYGRRL